VPLPSPVPLGAREPFNVASLRSVPDVIDADLVSELSPQLRTALLLDENFELGGPLLSSDSE